jgi:hypothetical protein
MGIRGILQARPQGKRIEIFIFLNLGASARLRRPDRALRLYLFCLRKKGYRSNPLRVPKSASCRILAMETAASMPQVSGAIGVYFRVFTAKSKKEG